MQIFVKNQALFASFSFFPSKRGNQIKFLLALIMHLPTHVAGIFPLSFFCVHRFSAFLQKLFFFGLFLIGTTFVATFV